MSLPIIAIVGRPNVGKSSLFNAISRQRTSIVEPTAGVTRDRVSVICDIDESYFELIDTGGYGMVERDDLSEHVERQIKFAVEQADIILFVVDAREGLNPLDRDTAEMLRGHRGPVKLLANKTDEPHIADTLGEFVKLGFSEPQAISAHSFLGLRELREWITDQLSDAQTDAPPDAVMKIAIVGKRNSGKSTFINVLSGEERVIVSEIPGTTRDSIDVRFEMNGRSFIAIDTAGVRKKNKIADDIEYYAYTRAVNAIQRSDVVLFMIDAAVKISQVDKRLAKLIHSEFKPCIMVVNKWDLAKDKASTEDYGDYLIKILPEVDFAPVSITTATTGQNIDSTIDLAWSLFKQSSTEIPTAQLNQALQYALSQPLPSVKSGRKHPKFFYATQVSNRPPTLLIFVNHPQWVTMDYERFLTHRFREYLPFDEIPIRLVFRSRREQRSRNITLANRHKDSQRA